jgi:glycosyltransferase involved in cell wall biosynthesis
MKISAIIVVLNEEKRLKDCLSSLTKFDDVIVVDLGSNDQSVEIAKSMKFKVLSHPWVPFGEMVLPTLMPKMKNDWILRMDPDEVLPPNLFDELSQLEVHDNIGIICLPYQYYFKGKKLDTTIWGGIRSIPRIINRSRVNVTNEVHRAYHCKQGYERFTLLYRPWNAILHFWADSYGQLVSKHDRYISLEGESRYNNGDHFGWKSLFIPVESFYQSFIKSSGWRGGWHGWFLSFFFAYYEARAVLALYRYEKKILS